MRAYCNGRTSKAEPKRQNHCRRGPSSIKYVGCEIDPPVRQPDQYTALNIEIGVVSLCPVCDKTRSAPFDRGIAELRPAVEETAAAFFRIEYEFPLGGEFQLFPAQRSQVSWRNTRRASKDAPDHRCSLQKQFVSGFKVIAKPHGAGLLILVVVARTKVKLPLVCAKRRRSIGLVIRHEVVSKIERERPLRRRGAVGLGCRSARSLRPRWTSQEHSHRNGRQKARGR